MRVIDGESEPFVLETEIDDLDVPIEADDDDGETVIGFAEDGEELDGEAPPLVTKLRHQLRDAQRQLRTRSNLPAVDDDPAPTIPAKKTLEQFDYDQDAKDAYDESRISAAAEHARWEARQESRKTEAQKSEQSKRQRIEQQVQSLGVGDYQARLETVGTVLSPAHLNAIAEAAKNAPQFLYALSRSETKLDEIAAMPLDTIPDVLRFAAAIGSMERDVKVQKRKAPPPETQVRGGTASVAVTGADKELARLEKEADRTGDRSAVIRYRRSLRAA
jgi:hypothetical protein